MGKQALVWIAAAGIFLLLMVVTPRIPQDEAYHGFADHRTMLGIPNALNVVSNFPFLIIGAVGVVLTLHGGKYFCFSLEGEILGWTTFFLGVAATAFGSSYYHLHPDDSRLVWDRLPMTVSFTAVMAVFIIERIDEGTGKKSVLPLVAAGALSVAYWRFADDLRPYALVQFVPCIAIPIMTVILPSQYTHSLYWLWAAVCYLLAKVAEAIDKQIYSWTWQVVSGHTLKHLLAALVPIFVIIMLIHRDVTDEQECMMSQWTKNTKLNKYFASKKSESDEESQTQSLVEPVAS